MFATPASTKFELFHSMKDEPKRKCPKCGRLKLRRLIGPGAAIVFKGSGFYKTDYRSESYKKGGRRREEQQNRAMRASPPRARQRGRRRGRKRKKSGLVVRGPLSVVGGWGRRFKVHG